MHLRLLRPPSIFIGSDGRVGGDTSEAGGADGRRQAESGGGGAWMGARATADGRLQRGWGRRRRWEDAARGDGGEGIPCALGERKVSFPMGLTPINSK